ncbi:MAG: hypothetical protein J5622_03880 [Firmicutes bacterium]|nr:hypothetical protein [Bacillota bacterium]
MYNRDWILKELGETDARLVAIDEELAPLPEGSLVYRARGRHCKLAWSKTEDGHRSEEHLSMQRDREIIYGLARKEYLKAEMRLLKKNRKALECMQRNYMPATQDNIMKLVPRKYRELPTEFFVIKGGMNEKGE